MIYPILLSLFAGGFATGLGGLILISLKEINKKILGFCLGFSSGVMIIIGIKDLFGKSIEMGNYYFAALSFIGGALLILAMDIFIPHTFFFKERGFESKEKFDMLKVGMLVAFGITIHNIPEGMIVGAGYLVTPIFGFILAIAIALHNIPEGIAVSAPLCAAGCSKKKVFLISLISGFSEPIGAIIALAIISFIPGVLPLLLGFTGGVMTYITMDELIPTARKYGHSHAISTGLILGLIITLLLGNLI